MSIVYVVAQYLGALQYHCQIWNGRKLKKKSYYLKTANSSWSVQPPNLQWCVRACEGFWRHCGQDVDTWCSLDLNLWSKIEMLQWKFVHTCSISGVGTLDTNQQGHAGFEGVWGAALVFVHSTSLPSHTCTLQLRRVCSCGHGVDSPGCRCCMARPALLLIALPAPALLLIGLRAAATVLYSTASCLWSLQCRPQTDCWWQIVDRKPLVLQVCRYYVIESLKQDHETRKKMTLPCYCI